MQFALYISKGPNTFLKIYTAPNVITKVNDSMIYFEQPI